MLKSPPDFRCPSCGGRLASRLLDRPVGGQVAECAKCGHLGLWPQPDANEIASWYADNALEGTPGVGTALLDVLALDTAARLDPRRDIKILDMGCGGGGLLRACAERGYDAEGVEVSQNLVARLVAQGLRVSQKSVDDLLEENAHFDWVFCMDVIEHVPEPFAFLTKLAETVRQGGLLIIETPNADAITAYGESAQALTVDHEHINYFGAEQLTRVLRSGGFELAKRYYLPRSSGSGRARTRRTSSVGSRPRQTDAGAYGATAIRSNGSRRLLEHLPPWGRGMIRSLAQAGRIALSFDELVIGRGYQLLLVMRRVGGPTAPSEAG